jgi:hypothetical protein
VKEQSILVLIGSNNTAEVVDLPSGKHPIDRSTGCGIVVSLTRESLPLDTI